MNGRELINSQHSEIGDGERRACVFFRKQLARAGTGHQVFRLAGDLRQTLRIGITKDGSDKPAAVRGHRDSQIDAIVIANCLALEGSVHLRILPQRRRAGFQNDVVVADLKPRIEQG